jgi:NADH-quinone oxidoreductase subunit M
VSQHLISGMIAFPFIGALLQMLPSVSRLGDTGVDRVGLLSRWLALVFSAASSVLGLWLVFSLQSHIAEPQMVESFPWVGSYAIIYEVAVDGLSVPAVLLVSLLFPILLAAEWGIESGGRGMRGLFLLLQSALIGATCAQDIFLQFFFWAFSALPFYFLISIWGGKRRELAGFRALVSASVSNAMLFGAIILIYYAVEPHSFLLRELGGRALSGKTVEIAGTSFLVSHVACFLIVAGMTLRLPVWPLHGWFTLVAQEARWSILVALAGGMIPVGVVVFVRLLYTLFPDVISHNAQWLLAVGAVNLVLGGICGAVQKDLRMLMAYLALSELGFVLVGLGSLDSAGVVGAVFQQFPLSVGLAGFGLGVGALVERTGTSYFGEKRAFGGIVSRAPAIAVVLGVVIGSLLGFPGLGGFVSHALLLMGSFASAPVVSVFASGTLILTTYYLFMMYKRVFLGEPTTEDSVGFDLSVREKAYLLPVVISLLVMGVYPKPLLELVRPTVLTLLSTMK